MKKLISIVIPAYNEEGCMEALAKELDDIFDQNSRYDFEAIVVENGSSDRTYEKLLVIHHRDPRFKIVRLARNFRMDGGLTAGLQYARGDAAVVMVANLQDPPAVISLFLKKWEEGFEHVYGIVKSRPGKGILRRLNSQVFYWLINRLTGNMIPRNVSDFRLLDRKVYQTINRMDERNRFMRGMFVWVGYKSTGVEFERNPRYAGESHARFSHVFQLAVQGIFAYSYFPLKIISFCGILLSAASLIYLVYTVAKILFQGVPFAGYGTIVSIIIFMFGFLFLLLGILGQYIAQIYEEVKGRPNFIVKEEIGFSRRETQDAIAMSQEVGKEGPEGFLEPGKRP
jgi:glycosyltransferase involved in cell wall biosynthesis